MWDLKSKSVPVVFEVMSLIKKETQEEILKLPGAQSSNEICKTLVTSTTHILRRGLLI